MDRIRQTLSRRRRSSSSSTTPLQSPAISTTEKRKNSRSESPRRLLLTSNTATFDQRIINCFHAEGFDVEYIPFVGKYEDPERDRKELENLIQEREDYLEPGERYAVVAYNRPAFLLLASHHQSNTTTNPFPRLCALVTYYPDSPHGLANGSSQTTLSPCVPPSTKSTSSSYSASSLLPVQIHLADHQSTSLWDSNYSYNGQTSKKRHRCHTFSYPESEIGFAEPSGKNYDRISSRLAWSRALDCLKRGFISGSSWTVPEIESVWEEYWRNVSVQDAGDADADHVDQALRLMVGGGELPHDQHDDHDGPILNCVPTMAGGSDTSTLSTFYNTNFLSSGPPSQTTRLLARTVGPDRIVDEMLLSFRHTQEIPWLLPNIPPTDRDVQIAIVVSASFCAGKLASQHLYWDQASVLVQIGLLDPGLVPGGFRATGKTREGRESVERLPVLGREEVERVWGD